MERIVLASRARITDALESIGPEIAAAIEEAVREIRAHLDEPQRRTLDEYFEFQRHHLERLLSGKSATPPGSGDRGAQAGPATAAP